ncbi:extensin family protein [Falsihalocynthiibacter sp. SS001]|uniref:extensin-like domain-containing protein n=1 Tax=Falsihalocynthiibacter sp. SS001 TaxID=3349698 RepID=UPI0036D2CB40
MRLAKTIILLAALAAPVAASASAPSASLRPISRPSPQENQTGQRLSLVPVYYNATVRPVPRPVFVGGQELKTARVVRGTTPQAKVTLVTSRAAVSQSLRPIKRPSRVARIAAAQPQVQKASLAVVTPQRIPTSKKGSICGVAEIRGQNLSAIPGKINGCGIQNPVRVTAVAGVPLSRAATMDCGTAKALNAWVGKGVVPIVGRLGGGVQRIDVVAGYNCRTRNNQRGAKISEHGKGRAVDISGITLNNGVFLSVLKGWNSAAQGKLLRAMHKAACGPFGTVLGPNADRFHQDHFHFDTARYRNGTYCR